MREQDLLAFSFLADSALEDAEEDLDQYQRAEYDVVFIDEATQLREECNAGSKAIRTVGNVISAGSDGNEDLLAKLQAGQTGWQAGGSSLLSFVANAAIPEKWRYDDALKTIVPPVADAVIGGENSLIMQQYQALREQGYGAEEAGLMLAGDFAANTTIDWKLGKVATNIGNKTKDAKLNKEKKRNRYERLAEVDSNNPKYGFARKSLDRLKKYEGYYHDITEVIQQAIANGRPQKEIEALQKGQKTVLDKIRNLVYEDKGLDAVLKLEEENIEKKW